MTEAGTHVAVVRVRGSVRTAASDVTAAEVPLELRLDGKPFAVIMRTPGDDRSLVAGFLLAERLIRCVDDLAAIEHCSDPPDDPSERGRHVVGVTLDDAAAARAVSLLASRRDVMANAACGVCGRATLASLATDLAPIASSARMPAALVASLPARLRGQQLLFDRSGGHHAAGIFDLGGEARVVAEDVGRHNAVDKVVGTCLLRDELPLGSSVLCVSGRTSYEIVQKAWCAGIPIVASVSAPSSLAVSLAAEAGITLAGFVRDEGLNLYTAADRIS